MLVLFPLAGGVAHRWPFVVLPLVGWPLFYVGLDRGWWGDGTGDGWQAAAVFFTCVGVVTTAVAVAAGRSLSRRPTT